NSFSNFRADIGDLKIHFIHKKAKPESQGVPLLILHGWPGPYRLFEKIIEPLHESGFELVIASLPGFPLSTAAKKRGMGPMRMADVMTALMAGLGYQHYGIVAEDIGASVASRMGLAYPERVIGIHLNMPIETPPRDQFGQLTDEERTWLKEFGKFRDREL